ncbi:ankyrin repeat-containing domain protein [Zopfochytrium polystomum]|nr:ankyrin repeat-containing domain protein [Zopfochytrium polystomum]
MPSHHRHSTKKKSESGQRDRIAGSDDDLLALPLLLLSNSTARSMTLSWSFRPDYSPPPGTLVQLVKSENGDPEYKIVYEGTDRKFVVENLKPETEYAFKLRVWRKDENAYSKTYAEVSGSTTDEREVNKAEHLLIRAVNENDENTAVALISKYKGQLNIEARDKSGRSLLMIACQKGSGGLVSALLRANALPTATTASHKTPLSIAVSAGNLPAVLALLSPASPTPPAHFIDMKDNGGSTPLMWAVENANQKAGIEIVAALIKAGADVDAEDAAGATALERVCATSGNARCARMLLEKGARMVNKVGVVAGGRKKAAMTTLMVAAINGNKEVCAELIDRWHADVFAETEFGQTARSMAASRDHEAVVALLDRRMKQRD